MVDIPRIDDLTQLEKSKDVTDCLRIIERPSWLFLKGKSNNSCRVVSTLLHGNEPSGIIAVLRLIKEGFVPAVDTWVLIASVQTALTDPIFSHRMLRTNPDLNRCFGKNLGQADDAVHTLAQAIVKDIEEFKPQAVADVHNTSGEGPGFCVAPSDSPYLNKIECFSNLFCQTLVLTDIHLGALMEHDFGGPIITVECGGNKANESHFLAYHGIKNFLSLSSLEKMPKANKFTTYRHPLRLEMQQDYYLNYASEYQLGSDLTLKHKIEQLNFGTTQPNKNLGWLGSEGLKGLKAIDNEGNDQVEKYFYNKNGELHAKQPLHLFMVTTNLEIAVSDCLFYFCEV